MQKKNISKITPSTTQKRVMHVTPTLSKKFPPKNFGTVSDVRVHVYGNKLVLSIKTAEREREVMQHKELTNDAYQELCMLAAIFAEKIEAISNPVDFYSRGSTERSLGNRARFSTGRIDSI